ncbi:MAG: hypothetical protein ACHREM_07020 [Polyangiales bacterium]
MAWYHRDADRLELEVELMTERTRAELHETPDGLCWVESLVSFGGETITLAIEYPARFPFEPPKAFVLSPSIDGAPHLLKDGSLCLWDNPATASGAKTSALAVRNRAVTWYLAYEVWKLTGSWEAPQH